MLIVPQYVEFNLNESVLIKLTDIGWRIHREEYDMALRTIPGYRNAYTPPVPDPQGFTRWQLWAVMQMFGPHISLGRNPPFDSTIRLLP